MVNDLDELRCDNCIEPIDGDAIMVNGFDEEEFDFCSWTCLAEFAADR